MRWIPCLAVAATLSIPAVVSAQQVTVAGWVDRVDTANSTITLRTLGNPRTIPIAPNAVVRVNGIAVRLNQIPQNGDVSIMAEKDSSGVLRATQINVRTATAQPSAAAPAGSIVRGTLVGMNIPNNNITVRTSSGDQVVAIGTAPIVVNGIRASTRNLRVGQIVQVERSLPTAASTDYITELVRVLPTPMVAAGAANRAGATTSRGKTAVRSRVAGSRSHYRARKSRSHTSRRTRRQARHTEVWKGTRFSTAITMPGESGGTATTAQTMTVIPGGTTATVAPGAAIATPGAVVGPATAVVPGTVVVPDTVVTPGVVATPGTVVVPGTTVVPGTALAPGVVGTAPQTTATNPRQQSGTAAAGAPGSAGFVDNGTALTSPAGTAVSPPAGVPDARAQSLATPGAAPPAVIDPRNQAPLAPGGTAPGLVSPGNSALVTPGAVLPGAAPAGVGDPRNQAIVTPGAVLPGAAAPPVGVPDPRFQSPLAPGVIGPVIPGPVAPGVLRPGFRPLPGLRRPLVRPVVPQPVAPAAPAPGR